MADVTVDFPTLPAALDRQDETQSSVVDLHRTTCRFGIRRVVLLHEQCCTSIAVGYCYVVWSDIGASCKTWCLHVGYQHHSTQHTFCIEETGRPVGSTALATPDRHGVRGTAIGGGGM